VSGYLLETLPKGDVEELALEEMPDISYEDIGGLGRQIDDLLNGVRDEFKENEDLPNTTNPDDWAKIAGKKRERIVSVKPLTGESKQERRDVERVVATGQYL
jgi:proteasome-associated ATPase